jgi:hypothetical protein
VVTVGTALSLALASPAFALARDDGDDPGPGLSAGMVLLVFIGVPVGLFLLIALLVSVPSMVRGPRYRPGLGWWAEPVWFGGPRGDATEHVASAEPVRAGGGTSARW